MGATARGVVNCTDGIKSAVAVLLKAAILGALNKIHFPHPKIIMRSFIADILILKAPP